MDPLAAVFSSIFNADLNEASTRKQLEDLTEAHPYFSAAQFFLLKMMHENEVGYEQQMAKTALLFNNPYWLQYQLKTNKKAVVADVAFNNEVIAPEMIQENSISENQALQVNQFGELIAEESNTEVVDTLNIEDAVAEEVDEKVQSLEQEGTNDTETSAEVVAEDPSESTDNQDEVSEIAIQVNEMPVDNTALTEAIAAIKNPNSTINEDAAAEALLFEPLHTSDYFASQGIKITDVLKPNDKLSNQLKSFTQWLKTMKKVHPGDVAANAGSPMADKAIQQLAEQSNNNDTVVTEAMANILIQQGKHEQAIEVLEKLSLLNPAKSVFFASQIKNLKEV
ncbi:MAG: hypothetical protein RLY16_1122 [Bacteroidota bacterium]